MFSCSNTKKTSLEITRRISTPINHTKQKKLLLLIHIACIPKSRCLLPHVHSVNSFKEKQIKNNWFISSKSRCSKISSIRISFAISLIKFSLYGQKQCLCFNLTISSTLIYSLASNSHILYINNSFIKPVLKLDAD